MTPVQTAFLQCQRMVRAADENRFWASAFAPAAARPHLFALYAFNHEIAKTAETVSQPLLGHIRLQWWRDALDGIYAGQPRQHEVAFALSETVRIHALPRAELDALIDARESDLDEVPFKDVTALEAYANATAGGAQRLALRILGGGATHEPVVADAATAYALLGTLRAFPFWAARGRVALPVDLLEGWSASGSQLLSDEGAPIRRATAKHLLDVAARYFSQAESRPFPRRAMAAILPMAETGKSLRRLAAVNFDPVTDAFAVPRVARQAAMLRAYVLGHL